MNTDQALLFALILLILIFLVWGRFRYDLVAFGALVAGYLLGVIPEAEVFSGFGHPAVIIIALVLIVSRGLSRSGAIEAVALRMLDSSRGLQAHIGLMAGISAVLSTVMNNVAALALLMPVDIQAARRLRRSPALTLMPLSFASILGGMVTLIGTPPNIVVATFRADALGEPYGMFDFAPVGLVVAVVGVLYITLVGWRLIPVERGRHDSARELNNLGDFITEVAIEDSSELIGRPLATLAPVAEEHEVAVLGLVRRGKRLPGTARREEVHKSDLIVLKGRPQSIDQFIGAAELEYAGTRDETSVLGTAVALGVAEVVVPAGARIVGRSVDDVRLLYRQGVSLIGVSRSGKRFRDRLRKLPIVAGDILLLLGPQERLDDVVYWLGCLPLAERGVEFTQRGKALSAALIFAAAIIAASFGVIYLPVALAMVVVIYTLLDIVPLSDLFETIEWPVIVLLGSMIPIGAAMATSGGTALIADSIVVWSQGLSSVTVLVILMIVTMTLSDVLNNVATALILAPIGIDIAQRLDANPDTFLMGVAVAASCAFLTPIGHKNNTIILGPGGYHFGDYWRMGLPLEALVLLVGVPAILWFWPL